MSAEESQSQDSNNEEISKKKSRKKHHKKKEKKKKHRKISSEEENSNEEENENEEEDEDSSEKKAKSKKNTNLKLPEVKEEPIKKTKDEYIAQIEQLQNELQLEQKISQSLDLKNENYDELINFYCFLLILIDLMALIEFFTSLIEKCHVQNEGNIINTIKNSKLVELMNNFKDDFTEEIYRGMFQKLIVTFHTSNKILEICLFYVENRIRQKPTFENMNLLL